MGAGSAAKQFSIGEKHHFEKSLLRQLEGAGWEIIDLTDMRQATADILSGPLQEGVVPPIAAQTVRVRCSRNWGPNRP